MEYLLFSHIYSGYGNTIVVPTLLLKIRGTLNYIVRTLLKNKWKIIFVPYLILVFRINFFPDLYYIKYEWLWLELIFVVGVFINQLLQFVYEHFQKSENHKY